MKLQVQYVYFVDKLDRDRKIWINAISRLDRRSSDSLLA